MSCFESNLSLMTVNNNYFQMISFKKLYCVQNSACSHAISLIRVSAFLLGGEKWGIAARKRRGWGWARAMPSVFEHPLLPRVVLLFKVVHVRFEVFPPEVSL